MKSLFLSLSLAALSVASPAFAEPAAPRIAVSTAGLDLTTDAGARTLELRILHAATALCGTPSPADARGRVKYDDCRDQARTAAAAGRDRAVALARQQVPVEVAASH